ncbi:MAG: flagellar basal body-associated FliL family protein [FCB group bacterium]|nr:flagellar basal body-associated FliL family protein [FCB group bacterium]
MADENLTVNENEEAEQAPEAKKGSALKTYGLYGAIVIVMIAAAYFVTLKVVKPMFTDGETNTEEVAAVDESDEAEEQEDGGHGAPSGHGAEGGEPTSNVFMVSDIIVNPAGTGGTRFLSTSIGIEMKSGEAAGLLVEREAIIRDALITILSSQSIPELSDFKQRERLRLLIKRRVEKLTHDEEIAAVYFTEFVLQ